MTMFFLNILLMEIMNSNMYLTRQHCFVMLRRTPQWRHLAERVASIKSNSHTMPMGKNALAKSNASALLRVCNL